MNGEDQQQPYSDGNLSWAEGTISHDGAGEEKKDAGGLKTYAVRFNPSVIVNGHTDFELSPDSASSPIQTGSVGS